MLNISSAFDTLDYQHLLSRLHLLGVRDHALSWFTSYLSDRSSRNNIYNFFSSSSPMKYGVPQGSVLDFYFSLFIYINYHPQYLNIQIYITIYMQMAYNYICFFPLIHHQVSIINSTILLLTLKNGLFLIIFSLIPQQLHC